ncbi:MAG: DUF3368 domain-containing protein [Nitrososphaerota archaeon]|nr:DUF3368 domain-containing protein [Nitrososphaerota archaeon]
MPAVSNTSPVLNLAIVGRLSLLRDQFETVMVPHAVRDELKIEEDLPGCNEIRGALKQGWLVTIEVKDMEKAELLNRELDRGESEAIALALQVRPDWVLVDEKEARNICKTLGLRVTGILGVLLKARRNGKVGPLKEVLDELMSKAGFRIGKTLYDNILREESNQA